MNAVALRFYVHEPRKHGHERLYDWLPEKAKGLGIHGGSAFFATAGYGRHGVIHEQRFFELPEVLPVMVEFIVTAEEADRLLDVVRREKIHCLCVEMPKVYRGVEQFPLSGVSMKYTFDATPDAPTQKKRQFYSMLGTRGMWEDGWLAATVHAPFTGKGHFDQDQWQLYHVDVDRAEATDLASQYPEKVAALKKAWDEEARINLALPVDDRTASEILLIERPSAEAKRDRYVYYPGTAPVPEGVAVSVRNRSYKILANVEITDANAGGVIFAHGSRFGGHALFIKDHRLYYVYNFLGTKPEQKFVSSEELKPGKYTLGMEFTRTGAGPHKESLGAMKLYVNDKVVAEGPMRTQPAKFTLSGDGLCIGYDSGDAVSGEYKTPGTFHGGTIQLVGVTVEKASYEDLEMEAQRALAID